jgi:glycerol-3-phosphate responsive antiterminator
MPPDRNGTVNRPPPVLPSVLVTSDGRHQLHLPEEMGAGILVRDTDLATLVHAAGSAAPPHAVDLDSVAGLGSDDAAIDYVTGRLGIRIVLTRRPQLAARAAARGHLGLVHVFAYDSTGMSRSLEGHPRTRNVGSVLSPGLVIAHLSDSELRAIPRPLLAYGLIHDVDDARTCLALADAIALRPAAAARYSARLSAQLVPSH